MYTDKELKEMRVQYKKRLYKRVGDLLDEYTKGRINKKDFADRVSYITKEEERSFIQSQIGASILGSMSEEEKRRLQNKYRNVL